MLIDFHGCTSYTWSIIASLQHHLQWIMLSVRLRRLYCEWQTKRMMTLSKKCSMPSAIWKILHSLFTLIYTTECCWKQLCVCLWFCVLTWNISCNGPCFQCGWVYCEWQTKQIAWWHCWKMLIAKCNSDNFA